MLPLGLRPNEFTFPFVLKSSSSLSLLPLGLQLHSLLLKSGLLLSNPFCACALLDLYSKLAPLPHALNLFDRIPQPNLPACNSILSALARHALLQDCFQLLDVMQSWGFDPPGCSSWNSIIAGCVQTGDIELALQVLRFMLNTVRPSPATFNTLLPVIPDLRCLETLKMLHGFALRVLEFVDFDPVDEDRLWAAIAAGYASLGSLRDASLLFERIRLKSPRLWVSMISGFLDCGAVEEAFEVFRAMAVEFGCEERPLPKVSLTLLLPLCGLRPRNGMEIHGYACKVNGLASNTSVCNALMAMYVKAGDSESADNVFDTMPERDIISWNTMLAKLALVDDFEHVSRLFRAMLADGVWPDEYSFSSVLNGCGHSSNLRQGMALHARMVKCGFSQSYLVVENALMDAYGKCGCASDARKVFDGMESRDTISWNTIISCCAFSASPRESFSLFDRMLQQGFKPNRVTFIALLSACSHAGLLEEGLYFFDSMARDHGVVRDLDHYACIIDNLGRVGELDRAYQFIKGMPIEPDECIWSALLNACRIYGNVELAEVAAKKLIQLDPQHSGYWVLLSNIYADASRWDDVRHVRAAMKHGGVVKCPGFSCVEIGGSETHKFLTGDMSHNQSDDIYSALDGLTENLKDEGYIPLLDHKFANV
ncbi:pentatricopeptide repeat-containing protein At4g21300-like [Dioscorea cayenensis subsp. rotundata]|uniref:Pentatricopeptide repeat-containing protein At4g21300-like n=1 Tax=Dioscorea cayennensis subsp. rotundata TaxID=55577 RepID=A0AB40C0P7_DIOCR|nr:pentatricopeptide repeat-containing protein At4g21300-like [Dioscorea cayenensis subsp. rotundata]